MYRRKAGNSFIKAGKCQTDKMYALISSITCEFNSNYISSKCDVSKNRASDFLRVLYAKGVIHKTGRIGRYGLIYYKFGKNKTESKINDRFIYSRLVMQCG